MSPVILSNKWADEICHLYGIDPARVARVIVDAKAGEVLRVYFNGFGDDRLLELIPSEARSADVYVSGDLMKVTTPT